MKATLTALLAILTTGSLIAADDHADTLGKATVLSTSSFNGRIDSADDEDWFKVTVQQGGNVMLYTTGKTDTYGTLHNEAGEWLGWGLTDDNEGHDKNFRLEGKWAAGTYYLKVSSGGNGNVVGDYTLSLSTPESATPFPGPNLDGSLSVNGDRDFYRFEVKTPGRVLVYSTGSTDTYGTLYDEAGNWLGWGSTDDTGSSRNFFIDNKMAAGTYYLRVHGGGDGIVVGDYQISIRSQDHFVPLNAQITDRELELLGQQDFFRFEVAQPGLVIISSTGQTDTYGQLYDVAGNWMGWDTADDNTGAGQNFYFANVMAAGTYYLRVRAGTEGLTTGEYQVRLQQQSDAKLLISDKTTHGTIETLGDRSLYAFNHSGGAVSIRSEGSTDTYASLTDQAGKWLGWAWTDDNAGPGNNFSMQGNLPAGRYLLYVRTGNLDFITGDYTIEASFSEGNLTLPQLVSQTLHGDHGQYQLTVESTNSWDLKGLPEWLTASTTTGAGGETNVTLTARPNTTDRARRATIKVGGTPHIVIQEAHSAGGASAPTNPNPTEPALTIIPAVILEIATEQGTTYRIETSTDMRNWNDVGIEIEGTGQREQVALPQTDVQGYQRVVAN